MSIGLSFSKSIIFLKIFNFENKSNPSISELSYFKHFSRFKIFSFKNDSDFNFLTLNKKQKYLYIF